MRYAGLPLAAHVALGATFWAGTSVVDSLQAWQTLVLWIFGAPWLAGLFALVLWPRSSTKLAWIVPATLLLLGLFLLLFSEAVSGLE